MKTPKLLLAAIVLFLILGGSRVKVYSVQPQAQVTGAFIQMSSSTASAEPAWWQEQLNAMAAIGMDTLVVQYVAHNEDSYYPTHVAGLQANESDSIAMILASADQAGIKVFLGLHLDDSFWSNEFALQERLKLNETILNELQERYGKSPALAGWYIPEELSDYTPANAHVDDLLEYIRMLTRQAHDKTKLPVMLSPYFGQRPDAAKYAGWWDKAVLPITGVDIVALQDGVGTHRTTVEEARPVFEAFAPVMKRHGVEFWANNESFDQIAGWPLDDNETAFAAQPVDFDRFIGQVASTAPLVEKSITFEFTQYMNPEHPGRARELYLAYQRYRNNSRSLPYPKQSTPRTQTIGSP